MSQSSGPSVQRCATSYTAPSGITRHATSRSATASDRISWLAALRRCLSNNIAAITNTFPKTIKLRFENHVSLINLNSILVYILNLNMFEAKLQTCNVFNAAACQPKSSTRDATWKLKYNMSTTSAQVECDQAKIVSNDNRSVIVSLFLSKAHNSFPRFTKTVWYLYNI